jgi:uncharacterized protein YjbI with pentapeptide repeats
LGKETRDLVVEKKNNFTFSDFSKNKKALKNRDDLDNSTFHMTQMDHTNLSGSNLEKSLFSHTGMNSAIFKKANLKGAVFEYGDADGANFEGADLEGAKFTNVHALERANFKNTIYEGKPGYGDKWTGKSLLDEYKEEQKIKRKKSKLESESKKGGRKSKKRQSKRGKLSKRKR